MFDISDTIAAVSSPTPDGRVILRISGGKTLAVLCDIFRPKLKPKAGIYSGLLTIGDFTLDAKVYLFIEPHSYTGETLAEIHFDANRSVTEFVLSDIMKLGVRPAAGGEFTARAYFNGKLDLAQAEAGA